MTSRRQMLARATGLAAVSALGLPAAFAQGSNYGIQGRQAPELEVDWWIDRDGKPTSFTLAGARGKWIYLECFHVEPGKSIRFLKKQIAWEQVIGLALARRRSGRLASVVPCVKIVLSSIDT